MSNILITDYRGCNIYFDMDKETFSADLNSDEWNKPKQLFSEIKKYIDDFIKANEGFEPFEVEQMPNYNGHNRIWITGIRKDNRFISEQDNGEKKQISDYYEKDWFLVNPENEPHFKTILELRKQRNELDTMIKEVESKVVKITLAEFKKTIIR